MKINTEYIKTNKTARFSTYGNLNNRTKYFWFMLHGSNMLCEQMLHKFRDYDPELHFIVAPEGLNRFYANGFSGEVVSSWMTSRDRLQEIEDFSNYLSTLYTKITLKLDKSCKRIILGFSQGGTTAYRWLHNQNVETNFLIAHSCWIPEDIDLRESKSSMGKITQIYTAGKQDPFFPDGIITKVKELVLRNQLTINELYFDGEHRIDRTNLHSIFELYIK